jgi:single-strand DNA-binding protein
MNAIRNKVQLIGRLGADPEIRTFESGKKRVRISLATSEVRKDESGKRIESTQWHNVVAWGKLADLAEQYLVKGAEVAVEGKVTYSNYETKTGEKRYITEIVMNDFLMLGDRK